MLIGTFTRVPRHFTRHVGPLFCIFSSSWRFEAPLAAPQKSDLFLSRNRCSMHRSFCFTLRFSIDEFANLRYVVMCLISEEFREGASWMSNEEQQKLTT